jgi:tetratricopeptide (TPR) repeat protein
MLVGYDGAVEQYFPSLFTLPRATSMSQPSRREKIEAMLQDEPHDQFLRYGLAIEYDNEARYEESLALFAGLAQDSPPHAQAFFRGAQLLVRLDRIDEARGMLREGIEVARQQGNSHAAGEMGELLASLGALGE